MSNNKYPIAFLSYSRFDDKAENAYLTKFCKKLSQTVEQYTGDEFRIFQDIKNIDWGGHWEDKIQAAIDEVFFLIPIITPKFFKRKACRDEVERFRYRERVFTRNDLILPIYFIDCPILHNESARESDTIAKLIYSRQWEDWRELRFQNLNSPTSLRAFSRLAIRLRDAIATESEISLPDENVKKESLATRLIFPYLHHYKQSLNLSISMTFTIVSGEGPDQKIPGVQFPGPGAVKRAEAGLMALGIKAGFEDEQLMLVNATRDFTKLEMEQGYICTIASPAVNPYTDHILNQITNNTIGSDHMRFVIDGYPEQPVRLSLSKWLLDRKEMEYLPSDTYDLYGEKILFYPRITSDKLEGIDYGLLVRRVIKQGEIPQLQIVLAGCKNYGTWAAYLAATNEALIEVILKRSGIVLADLESERTIWALLKGVGHGGLLDPKDVSVISCGFLGPSSHRLVPTPATNNTVTDLEILQFNVNRTGYLSCGIADIRNIYQNHESSVPYKVTFVYKDGYDSVAILLYFIRDKHIHVGTIENLRPALHIRKLFNLPKRDEKEYVYFRGIIAGALEKLEDNGGEYVNRRAAQEIMEESGFKADSKKIVDLGSYFVSPGYCLERMFLRAYELEDFKQEIIQGDGTLYEEGIRVIFHEVRDVLSFYSDGTFEDPKTEIAIRRLCSKLGYIPEIDMWYNELDISTRKKYRRLFP
uniref:TIR domain-containing protein n=1 Tax=Candidatus Kentrum sp. LFY TaxID=2126342 RepID=A0A450USD1_9GAMM|nr:MAG: TIR domain-containing protein [Candidatus Kentron sp. LFY]